MKWRLAAILKSPYVLIRWILCGNTHQDWVRVFPDIIVMMAFLVLSLLAFDGRNHGWMEILIHNIMAWPLLELLTLIVTPLFMWWFDPHDDYGVSPGWRVIITMFFVLLFLAVGYYKILIAFPMFFLIFFTMRFLPFFYLNKKKPSTADRKLEMTRLGFVFLYLILFFGPVLVVSSLVIKKFDLDIDFFFYPGYFLLSTSYFTAIVCIGLKARWIRRANAGD